MSFEINPTKQSAPFSAPIGTTLPHEPRQSDAEIVFAQDISTQPEEKLEIESRAAAKLAEPVQFIETLDTGALRQQLEDLIAERSGNSEPAWYSEEGACMDFAALWYQDLKAKGLPVSLAITDTKGPQGKTLLDSKQQISVDKLHAFIVLHTPEGELILDPTWKQFTADKKAVSHLPSIAFGTLAEIKSLYANAQQELQLETHGHDPLQGRYHTETTADLLYSAGTQQAHRQLLNE
jgi:hypothetical protein